jgi:hypothetical protein
MKITLLNPDSKRKCGGCTLCCKLLPVPVIDKPSNTRCAHQRMGKGCAIYDRRPAPCWGFSCRWLLEDDTADLSRPDRSHYVIDPMPDFVTVSGTDGNGNHVEKIQLPVLQIWVDKNYPDAHRDPALRDYIQRRAVEDGCAALIRYTSREAFLLVPPALAGTWVEHATGMTEEEHTPDQIFGAFGL